MKEQPVRTMLAVLTLTLGLGAAETPTLEPGASWNESRRYIDPVSGLPVIQLTTAGEYNQGPVVHAGKAFPGGRNEVLFGTSRNGKSAVMTANLETGELRCHFVGPDRPENYQRLLDNPETRNEVLKHYWSRMFDGSNMAASLHHRQVAVVQKPQDDLLLINLDTNHVETAMRGWQHPSWKLGNPAFSSDGAAVAVCAAGLAKPSLKGAPVEYILYNLRDRQLATIARSPWGQCHIYAHPQQPGLWVIKKGIPSFLERTPERRQALQQQPDCFLFDAVTARETPLIPRNVNKNIAHSAWTGDGSTLVYHGNAAGGGMFVGAMDRIGKIRWEYLHKEWNPKVSGWNHIAADSVGPYIIDDGMMKPHQISLIDYTHAGSDGAPRVIPLAQWRNQWLPGQQSHPHPAVSPDGRFVVFYGCRNGKTHLYAVDISKIRAELSANQQGGKP